MLEFRLAFYQMEEARAKELAEAICRHPGCCDGVWLTSMGYYPPLWKHEEYANGWVRAAEIFREAGIPVSMQIANTLGHGDFDQLDPQHDDLFSRGVRATPEDDPYMVGPDGTNNIGCFCWRSPGLREYIRGVVKTYVSKLHPDRLWFDDDLRAHHHAPNQHGCFCNRCIADFNALHGASFTRESLVWEINYGDVAWRERFVEFCRQGLYEFTKAIASAACEVAPDTMLGLEHGHSHHYTTQYETHLLDALHDVNPNGVATRPGSSHYNDKAPWGQFEKSFHLSCMNYHAPDYVTERLAEIENLPGVVFGKSIAGIVNEGTLDLAFGCTGLTFTDVQSCHEPMAYYEKIFAALADAREYWNQLSHLSCEHAHGGIAVYTPEKPHLAKLSAQQPAFSWKTMPREKDLLLLRLGVPLSYDATRPGAYLLHHSVVDALTDRDIQFLLTQPVLTDGESVDKLCQRGYADYFALTPTPIGEITEEHFPPCAANGDKAGLFYTENCYAAAAMNRYVFHGLDLRTEVIGEAHNNCFLGDGQRIGACTVITELKKPAAEKPVKWAIFGYSIWSDIVSSAKRNQILSALDAIAPMPARLLDEEQAALIPCVDQSGATVGVTVSSASQNGTDEMRILVRNPRGKTIRLQSARRRIGFAVESQTDDSLTLRLDPLLPYEIATFFFD